MSHLSQAFPSLRRLDALPLSRDQIMMLMAATNLIFLGIDIVLAHSISGTIVPYEWIPIIFGPTAGALLLVAGLIAMRNRPLATWLATAVLIGSIAVGLLGAYFHVVRAVQPFAPAGQRVNIDLLVWGPPILGPLTFSLVGLIGISAAWMEDPPDSGVLLIAPDRKLRLPYSKTRAYFFMISMGVLATLISSVLDHARTSFSNSWLWVPTLAGVFATVVAAVLGMLDEPSRFDLQVYVGSMLLLMVVGVVGLGLHIRGNLIAEGTVVGERFIRGAPFLAPLLFADMGALGVVTLLNPKERAQTA